MDPRLLRYYNRELQYMREMGGEFAREFPKIAARLGLDGFECSDPYVERLLEGFAFLAARVQLKLDAEFPRFTQHLMEMVYPHYLAPTPSMAVVQMGPNLSEGALAGGFPVPRGTSLRSVLGKGDQTACEYRTSQDVTLWPIEIVKVDYSTYLADMAEVRLGGNKTARAAVRIRLRTTAGLKFNELALDTLTLFVRGTEELPMRLFEQLTGHALAVVVRPTGKTTRWQEVLTKSVSSVGFDSRDGLLPFGPRSFDGYRLLQEYFAFPQRYLFCQISGLQRAMRRAPETELELVVLLDAADAALEGAVDASNLVLFCAPAVNLFSRQADRIHLNDSEYEYHLVPDRTRPMDFEVYGVTEVVGYGASADAKQTFSSFYAAEEGTQRDQPLAYYTVRREPRMLSAKQRAHGPRSSYVGSELFLSLVDPEEAPYRSQLKQLGVATLCTNRDLPLHMSLGQGRTDFTLESGAPVASVRCLAGPTPPRPSHAHGETAWRLISHLSLNYLSLTDSDGQGASALRELLMLYGDSGDPSIRKQIDGLRSVSCKPVTRRLPFSGPLSFGRGLEVTLSCNETAFEGSGVFLLGAVLERFFAKYASINSFTETVLHTPQRGEIMRWPTRLGLRHAL